MSFVQPSTIHAIGQSLEVGTISDEAAKALSPDVEYRLREIVQVHPELTVVPSSLTVQEHTLIL